MCNNCRLRRLKSAATQSLLIRIIQQLQQQGYANKITIQINMLSLRLKNQPYPIKLKPSIIDNLINENLLYIFLFVPIISRRSIDNRVFITKK